MPLSLLCAVALAPAVVPAVSSGAAVLTPLELDIPPMRALIERYSTDRSSLASFYFLEFSPRREERLRRFTTEWQQQLEATPFDTLDQDGKVDYLLLKNQLDRQLQQLDFRRGRFGEIAHLLPFADDIYRLEEARWEVIPLDPQDAAQRIDAMTKQVREIRRRVDAGRKRSEHAPEAEDARSGPFAPEKEEELQGDPIDVSRVHAQRAAQVLSDLRRNLDTWFKHYDGYKPAFSWWTRKPYEGLSKELDDYGKLLKEEIAGIRDRDDDPLIGDPIGREAILADLRYEMIPDSPEDLVEIAKREFAWCEAEMLRASREMGFGDDWKAALEKVKTLHVPVGEQDELVAQQARDAIKFVEDRNLVTVEPLARETWRVDMLGLQQQRVLPFAAYGGQRMLVSYPLDSMDHDTKLMSLRGNNIHFTRIVTPHELIPGHHLQGYMAQRYRPYRREFSTAFYGEGWCLHWEMLLWDLDYPRGPEDRIGMLFWRMHRCARIIVSLGFHLGTMEPQEMIDFLVDRVGHERWTATSEVRRFIGGQYSPLYQCAYMIGGLQVRALYQELVGGKKMTPREFHDAVLKENSIPIALIRAKLTNQPLTREFRPAPVHD
jgi:hypothetical protein